MRYLVKNFFVSTLFTTVVVFVEKPRSAVKSPPKCDIADEGELFVKGAVIHSKIGEPHLRKIFPTLYKLWLSYD